MVMNEGEEMTNLELHKGNSVTIYDGGYVHMCSISIAGIKYREHDDIPGKMSRCDDFEFLPRRRAMIVEWSSKSLVSRPYEGFTTSFQVTWSRRQLASFASASRTKLRCCQPRGPRSYNYPTSNVRM